MAGEDVELSTLADELRLTPDVLLGPDMPAILANHSDGELVEVGVGAQKWVRLASYASLKDICTGQGAPALQGFSLGIYVMPYFPAGEAKLLRSGTCHGVAFRILNPGIVGTKMIAAEALVQQCGELPSLVEDVQAAIDELRELGCTAEDPPAPSYSVEERKLANLRYFRSLMEEGVDPHNTILHVDAEMHNKIYCQDGAYDPCKPCVDSEVRRNLTLLSLQTMVDDVRANDRKIESGRILQLEGKIDDDAIARLEWKMAHLLRAYQNGLRDHMRKAELLSSAPSVIGCGVPRYTHDEVPTSPPVSDGEITEAHLPWSEDTDEEDGWDNNLDGDEDGDGVVDASP